MSLHKFNRVPTSRECHDCRASHRSKDRPAYLWLGTIVDGDQTIVIAYCNTPSCNYAEIRASGIRGASSSETSLIRALKWRTKRNAAIAATFALLFAVSTTAFVL